MAVNLSTREAEQWKKSEWTPFDDIVDHRPSSVLTTHSPVI
jgi:hypothetical protein